MKVVDQQNGVVIKRALEVSLSWTNKYLKEKYDIKVGKNNKII